MCDFCECEENDLIICNQSGIIRTCFQDNEGNFLYSDEIGAGGTVARSKCNLFFVKQNSFRCRKISPSTYQQ